MSENVLHRHLFNSRTRVERNILIYHRSQGLKVEKKDVRAEAVTLNELLGYNVTCVTDPSAPPGTTEGGAPACAMG